MESIEIIPKNHHRRNISFIFKYCNLSFSKPKEAKVKKYKVDYDGISLKSKNTQSISTGPDDKIESRIKKSNSQKTINISYILNHLSKRKNVNGIELVSKVRRKGSTPEKNAIEVININEKGSKNKCNDNKPVKSKKNDSIKNIINTGKNKNINPKINNNKIGKIFKEDNSLKKEIKLNNKAILKPAPPKINEHFYYKYDLSNNGFYIRNTPKCEVPNVFINHLMLKDKTDVNNESSYLLLSTTNRIKAKKLNIIYYRPIKTNL
jgi:hypothetical protein